MASLGLTAEVAARRLADHGPNAVPTRPPVPLASRVVTQLRDPLVLVLLAACGLTVLTGDVADTVVIALVVAANTTVGVVQELRADRAVSALAELAVPMARVRRDGAERVLPSADLVPGDVVLLSEGDVVPADGEAVEATSVLVDASALTGESVPVPVRGRSSDEAGETLSAGTVLVKGRAVLEVARTGSDSALGRIAALTDVRAAVTPLQRRMGQLGRLLAVVVLVLSGLVLVLGLLRGESLEPMLVTALSLAVAAVPESLPAVVSLSLALGARRMAASHAVVRRLPAVETLGSVTVLATDKTGTLTEGSMLVEELWVPSGLVSVEGRGYRPQGSFRRGGLRLDADDDAELHTLLEACALCNDARLVPPAAPEAAWSGLGDPTEVALLAAAGKAGLTREDAERRFPRVSEVPFDSNARHMTTVHGDPARPGHLRVFRKGSPEALALGRASCPPWREALDEAAALAARGFRVLAVESGETDRSPDDLQLDLLGLVAIDDPVRPAARSTVASCRAAGIVTVLITGDHPATALAVAQRVGVVTPAELDDPAVLATGDEIADHAVADLTVPRVFARTRPEQKLDIVAAWQHAGAIVAMTGDGVNDGPALRRADIGVAMGRRGTEVARQAADLVLADDQLATVEQAVGEGRRVYDNIRRFLVFGMSGGAAEILVMLLGPLGGLTLPLRAAQILWVNLLTHGLTGVAMGAEPAEADVMTRPARPPEQSVVGDGLWQRVLATGAVIATVSLAVALLAHDQGHPWQSMLFLTLTSLQLGVALGLRPVLRSRANPWFLAALGGSYLLALAGIYLPPLRELLGLAPLSLTEVLVCLGLGVIGTLAARVVRSSRRRRTPAT